MYQTLKNLSPAQQVGAMFVLVFGLLMVASLTKQIGRSSQLQLLLDEQRNTRIHRLGIVCGLGSAIGELDRDFDKPNGHIGRGRRDAIQPNPGAIMVHPGSWGANLGPPAGVKTIFLGWIGLQQQSHGRVIPYI